MPSASDACSAVRHNLILDRARIVRFGEPSTATCTEHLHHHRES